MDVFAHTLIIIMPCLNARGLQSKLLIVSEGHNIIILQVWCSLKSVTTMYTLGLLFSWLHNYTALHSCYNWGT